MIKKVLVLGATGTQGFPAVKELVNSGFSVRGMSREGSPKAAKLNALGAQIVNGDLFDEESLYQAMLGMDGVLFIPPVSTSGNPIPELTVGLNAVHAAERAGIQYLIHTSVDRAGDQEGFVGWGENFGYNYRMYWMAKSMVIDFVKASNIPHWTVFKPSLIMEDFIPPIATMQYPTMKDGALTTAICADRKIGLISVEDQGKLIAKAFSEIEPFDKKEIPLAGDRLTMGEIADVISAVTGKEVKSVRLSSEEFLADPAIRASYQSLFGDLAEAALTGTVQSYEWESNDGYTADPAEANGYGVKLSTFREWSERHKADFVID